MRRISVFLVCFLLTTLISFGQEKKPDELLSNAIYLEEVKGNLEEAILIYQDIIKKYPEQRAIAAEALFHLGLSNEKLGNKKAKGYYETLVNSFGDQTKFVRIAKERLSLLLRVKELIKKGEEEYKLSRIYSGHNFPHSISPDGKKLALLKDWSDIILMDIVTKEEVRLTNEQNNISKIIWSPDSKMIAFIDNPGNIYVVPAKGGQSKMLIMADPEAKKTKDDIYFTCWTSDSKKLLFQVPSKGLFAIPASGGEWEDIFTFQDSSKAKEYENITLSPDGRFVAYEFTQDGNLDIYVMPVDGGESVRITKNPAEDRVPQWSYDGRWITFFSFRTEKPSAWVIKITPDGKLGSMPFQYSRGNLLGGNWAKNDKVGYISVIRTENIYIANPDGSNEYQLTEFPAFNKNPRWSPDGEITFSSDYDQRLNSFRTWTVPSKGGKAKLLDSDESYIWSRDRKLMAFVPKANPQKILMVSAEGGEPKELVTIDGSIDHLEWSPDGKGIVFSYSITPKKYSNVTEFLRKRLSGISIISIDGGKATKLIPAEKNGVVFWSPRWSPDGKKIAFRTWNQNAYEKGGEKEIAHGIWTIDAEGGEPKLIVDTKNDGYKLCWTPNGKYIVYEERINEMDFELCKVLADGGEPEKMNIRGRSAAFSPDGKKIAYSRRLEGYYEFWLVENFLPLEKLAQKEKEVEAAPKTITSQKVWSGPDTDMSGTPSPDGEFLTFMDYETGNLAIHNILTSESQLITKEATWEKPMQFTTGSKVSPNGKQIAYSWYNVNSNYEIRLTDVDNPQPKVLYGNKGEDVYPAAWSADGKIIYARSHLNKTQQTRILAITIASGEIQILKTIDVPYWTHLSASPDNQFIVFDVSKEKDNGNFDIHMISTISNIETSLIEHPANDRLLGWFPNKNQILFKSDRSGTWDVWTVSVLNGKPIEEPKRILTDFGQISPMGFTNNGTFYYSFHSRKFTALSSPLDIVNAKLELESGKPMLGSIMYAELSPDGKSIAYTKEIQETAGPGWYYRPLFVMDLESGKEILLLDWDEARYPKWSPDGKTISITGYEKGREFEKDYRGGIYTIEIESAKVTEILAFSMLEEKEAGVTRSISEWSKDQKSIYYNTINQLIKRELKSGQEEILFQNKMISKRTLDLSPDGEWLLFSCENHINIIPSHGGEAKTLYSLGEDSKIEIATWSPDGKYVFFVEQLKKGSVLWRITNEGKNPIEVCQLKGPIPSISIHPNGNEMIITAFNEEVEIWRTTNLLLDRDTTVK